MAVYSKESIIFGANSVDFSVSGEFLPRVYYSYIEGSEIGRVSMIWNVASLEFRFNSSC